MDTKKHIQEMETEGFTVLENLLTEEECTHYKRNLEETYGRFASHYANASSAAAAESLANKSGEKVVYNLHNKHEDWFSLFAHPSVTPILDSVLKAGSYKDSEPYYLYNISARSPLKGGGAQQLHCDSNLPGVNYCLIANVVFALDPFTLENGATRVVKGSHKWCSYPPDGESHPEEIRLTAPQGSAVIFNANLWHGGAANNTDSTRWAVLLGYARWFIKPSFDFMKCTPSDLFQEMTEQQKEMLGFYYVPPKDEFTRLRRRSSSAEIPDCYNLP
jgi:ectoine hydroxylase-related dioxygenase (phytanoyl-CoA dioxygenase family)